ncbi:Hypp8064 [Branchiostoma lanceolatum]|uniref:Hypp8064 protein n=1 Tax=Branchiostoma lanceolatum TaxID=7740 RepID=A0A8J9Z5Z1_BRALA|nr:Hypp8064 [Branchiostoma lanceolatum]
MLGAGVFMSLEYGEEEQLRNDVYEMGKALEHLVCTASGYGSGDNCTDKPSLQNGTNTSVALLKIEKTVKERLQALANSSITLRKEDIPGIVLTEKELRQLVCRIYPGSPGTVIGSPHARPSFHGPPSRCPPKTDPAPLSAQTQTPLSDYSAIRLPAWCHVSCCQFLAHILCWKVLRAIGLPVIPAQRDATC